MGEDIVREFGMDMHTLLYLKWIITKDLLYSTRNPVECNVAAWMGEEFGGEWLHVYAWLSLFAVRLKLSQHCLLVGYTLIQNKKSFKKEVGVATGDFREDQRKQHEDTGDCRRL